MGANMNKTHLLSIKTTSKRYALCILGILLTSLSTAIFYLLQMGSDPIQVTLSGVADIVHIPYGTVIFLFNLTIGILMLLFARKYVRAALFLTVLCAGFLVDGYLGILSICITPEIPLPVKIILGIAGCILMSLGIYLYLLPELGASPTEGIGLFMAEKLGIEYGKVRLGLDLTFAGLGFLLGGNFGIITIFAMLTTGPIVSGLERVFRHKLVH